MNLEEWITRWANTPCRTRETFEPQSPTDLALGLAPPLAPLTSPRAAPARRPQCHSLPLLRDLWRLRANLEGLGSPGRGRPARPAMAAGSASFGRFFPTLSGAALAIRRTLARFRPML